MKEKERKGGMRNTSAYNIWSENLTDPPAGRIILNPILKKVETCRLDSHGSRHYAVACSHGHGHKPSTPKMGRIFFIYTGLLGSQRLSKRLQASVAKQARYAFFCVITQHMVVIPCRAFFLDFLTLEDGIDRSSRNVGME